MSTFGSTFATTRGEGHSHLGTLDGLPHFADGIPRGNDLAETLGGCLMVFPLRP